MPWDCGEFALDPISLDMLLGLPICPIASHLLHRKDFWADRVDSAEMTLADLDNPHMSLVRHDEWK